MKHVIFLGVAVAFAMMTSNALALIPIQDGKATQDGKKIPLPPPENTGDPKPDVRGADETDAKPTPVALKEGVVRLSPENTKVDFVGTHVGSEPNPRLGGFKRFKGLLTATDDGASIKSMSMEFETGSMWTEVGDQLTNHLKSADFLDVEKYPTAKFVSTDIKAGEKEGMLDIVGDFTLMDQTNQLIIPVSLKKTDAGLLVSGNFKFDRTSFGMTKMVERVSSEVSIALSIGEKTTGGASSAGQNGRPAEAGGPGGRGGRDPSVMFRNQDANGDGKLSGDEIPEFLKGRMESIDTDGDQAITLDELQKMIQARGAGRGRVGAPPERGDNQ